MGDKSCWPEGRPLPTRGQAALSRSAPCACGRWDFRDFTLNDSVAAHERYCPRCRRRVLLVFRRGQHVGTVVMPANFARFSEMRASLSGAGLTESEVEMLMQIAEGVAS